jgi:hypothetical protein
MNDSTEDLKVAISSMAKEIRGLRALLALKDMEINALRSEINSLEGVKLSPEDAQNAYFRLIGFKC